MKDKKTIETKYKKLDHISHVLHRPQTYLGSNKEKTGMVWVYDVKTSSMTQQELTHIPSFIKIFDEILVNSVDESKRDGSKLSIIKVKIESDVISVWDNGGIPVVIHKEYKEYVPEVIFGNLMSGSNYDDEDDRTGAGVNGLGGKLTNIFSTEFTLTTADGKKMFEQVFTNNMRDRTKAKITKSTKSFTEISYKPELSRFGLSSIDSTHLKMLEKRVYDIAGCNPSLKIYFNGTLIPFKSFEDYVKLYSPEFFYEKSTNWAYGVSKSDSGYSQVSFVNSTETYDGGTHVDYIVNQIIVKLREFFKTKHKVDIKPSDIKPHLSIFINTTIINPSFSSQTKEKLITEFREFGSVCEVTERMIKLILKSEIVASILDWIEQKKKADDNKLARELNKTVSNLKVDKLIDAKARNRWNCSLGLFEGDCLGEDTQIRVLRDGELIDVSIKSVHINDMVITHENRFREVTALTKKIEYKNTIKTSLGDIISSKKHKLLVYDTSKNEFYFEKVSNINKTIHKLVKNQLCFMDELLKIESINNGTMVMESGDSFDVSIDHSMCVYNKTLGKFKMVEFGKMNTTDYLLVNTFGL